MLGSYAIWLWWSLATYPIVRAADFTGINSNFNLSEVDVSKDLCSMQNLCPNEQNCVHVDEIGFICKCPLGFVGTNCSTGCLTNYADITFLLDSSDSVSDDNWVTMLHFVSSAVQQLQVEEGNNRIAVITFGNTAHVEMNLDDYNTTQAIIEQVKELHHRKEKTNIANSLRLMRLEIFTTTVPKRRLPIGILITDGSSTVDAESMLPESQLTRAAGITMFVIGIGTQTKPTELETVASHPLSKHMFNLADFLALSNVLNSILESTCDLVPRYESGATGYTGMTGPVGSTGPAGASGEPGTPGTAGIPGIIGNPGRAGNDGLSGADGDVGYTGATGYGGQQGSTGYRGVPGIPGDKGYPGNPGPPAQSHIGLPGLSGLPGRVGVMGPLGGTGPDGTMGDAGLSGLVGLLGSPGSPGESGIPGPLGIRGPPGPSGPPGQQGEDGPTGYIYEDSDECALNLSLCQHTCVNKRIGYECLCKPGYRLQADGFTCHDIDECLVWNGGCEHHCMNTDGSFICACRFGYTVSKDDHTCIDVDECCSDQIPINPCPATHKCINTRGSYSCIIKERVRIAGPKAPEIDVEGPNVASSSDFSLESIFLRRNLIIGIFIWLCVLTVLTIIIVILASTINQDQCPIQLVESEYLQERALRSAPTPDDHARIFPRINLPGARHDDAIAAQTELHHHPEAVRQGTSK